MTFNRRRALETGLAALASATGLAAMNRDPERPGHVVLLGDSIFDNGAYVPGKPAVIDQLRKVLPRKWQATLLAVDGDVVSDVPAQLERLPEEATHLVMSAGGNDALQASGIFAEPVRTGAEALLELSKIRQKFDADYRSVIKTLLSHHLPTVVCTIYDPNFPIEIQQRLSVTGLAFFNDCITRAASREGLPLIDLRLLFTQPADYANSIEPSHLGGAKIVREIGRIVTHHDFSQPHAVVYSGR